MNRLDRTGKNTKIFGVLMLLVAIFIFLSLLSYNANDSSLNVADDEKIKNICGSFGAIVSDLLLQLCGLSSVIIVFVFVIWGLGLLTYGYLPLLWIRIPSLFLCICSASTILAFFSKYNFAMQMLPGGYIGYFVKGKIGSFTSDVVLFFISLIILAFTFYISIGLVSSGFAKERGIIQNIKNIFIIIKQIFNVFFYIIRFKFVYDLIYNKEKIFTLVREMILSDKNVNNDNITKVRAVYTSKSGDSVVGIEEDIVTKDEKNDTYISPSINLLKLPIDNDIRSITVSTIKPRAEKLLKVLDEFGVKGSITNYFCGPVVTLFELRPQPGTKASRVVGLSSDIARTMEVVSARVSIIPGKDAIGIELPNPQKQIVYLRSVFESSVFVSTTADLPIVLGKTISGDPIVVDLAKMPHLLIAGTTGSGKSVGVSSMILSLIYKMPPEKCKFVMIDPKMLEFSMYDGIPHLLTPVITSPKQAIMALKWVVLEMENRYKLMSNIGVRNISGYNDKVSIALNRNGQIVKEIDIGYDEKTGHAIKERIFFEAKHMPFIVVIIDEMADLMLVAGKEIESLVQRLAQMARAAGIHLIMATQRPSVDVITGVIKANFPTRISYHVTSKIDSRTILGEQGAEKLLGHGDMLYMSGGGKISRIHGPFVSDDEISKVVADLKSRYDSKYIDLVINESDSDSDYRFGNTIQGFSADEDDLYNQAVEIVLQDKKTSISYIQRKLRIGYNKAANLIEKMEKNGILSSADNTGKRIIV